MSRRTVRSVTVIRSPSSRQVHVGRVESNETRRSRRAEVLITSGSVPDDQDRTCPGPGIILLGRDGSPGLGFIRVADYRPPTWPDPAQGKQIHLELGVDDLDAAQARLLALGAAEPAVQPQPDERRVLLDPAGHPFCIAVQG